MKSFAQSQSQLSSWIIYLSVCILVISFGFWMPRVRGASVGVGTPEEVDDKNGTTSEQKRQTNICGNAFCPVDFGCDYSQFPVCGSNGITYINECWLICDRACQPPPPLAPPLDPVHPGPCLF